ncbi:MAG: BatD family protein [Bacteroidota bacterium]
MKRIIFIFILILFVQFLIAQRFYVQTASTILDIDQSMEILISAENMHSDNIVLPEFKDFKVVAGPTKTEETNIINGKISENFYWNIYVMPKHVGICKIEKATLITPSGKVYTKEVVITVNDPKAISATNNATNIAANSIVKPNQNFILKVITDKSSVYAGEEFIVIYKLYINDAIEGGQIIKDISNPNFIVLNNFNSKSDQVVQKEMIGNKMYTSVVIQKTLMTCTKVGTQPIGSVQFNVSVKQKPKSFIEEFLGVESKDILIQSDPITIDVISLPEPKPILFDQSIGQFKIEGHLNKTYANTNEPIIYSLKISGVGNLRNSLAPILQLPKCFEQYDAQKNETYNFVNYKTASEIEYQYMFTPHEPGKFKMEAPHMAYFDPQTKKYITLEQDSFEVQISGKASAYNNQTTPINTDTLSLPIYSRLGDVINLNEPELYKTIWVPIVSSPILLILFFAWHAYKKNKKLHKVAKQLSNDIIEQRIDAMLLLKDSTALYKEADRLLLDFLATKFDKGSFSSLLEIKNTLLSYKLDHTLIDQIVGFLEENQKKVYAPYTIDTDKNDVVLTLKKIIHNLNEAL